MAAQLRPRQGRSLPRSTTDFGIAICLYIIRLWRWNRRMGKWRCFYQGGLPMVCALIGYTGLWGRQPRIGVGALGPVTGYRFRTVGIMLR